MSTSNVIICKACGQQIVDPDNELSGISQSGRDSELVQARIAALTCPSCEHESVLDGDWIVDAGTGQYSRECPDCGFIVPERPELNDCPSDLQGIWL